MQKFKRITSAALGTLMTGASLLAPAFADLSTFGTWTPANTLVVVGADADAVDIVGGMNIAAAVAQHGASGRAGASGVAGAEQEDVALGSALTAFSTMRDSKLAGFKDDQLTWGEDDEEIDYEETLNVDGVEVLVSQTDDEDLGDNVVLGTRNDAIKYRFEIDDADFNYTAVDDEENELEIEFLGTSMKVTDVNNGTTDSITYEAGTRVVLGQGDSVEVNGKTLTVKTISDGKVRLEVDGQSETIDEDASSEVGTTDVKVTVEDVFYEENDVDAREVELLVGSETTQTVDNGDAFELFGEVDDEDDAEWVWVIDVDATDLTDLTLGIDHNQVWTDAEDEEVLAVGESWTLPGDYATVEFTGLTAEADVEYTVDFEDNLEVDEDNSGNAIAGSTRYEAVAITSSSDSGFEVTLGADTEETDTVYFYHNTTSTAVHAAFLNSDGKVQMISGTGNSTLGDTFTGVDLTPGDNNHQLTMTVEANVSTTAAEVNLTVANFGQTTMSSLEMLNVNIADQRIGATDEEAESADIELNNTAVGTREESVRTIFGNVLETPEEHNDADEVHFWMTGEADGIEATVTVSGPEGATTVAGSGNVNFVSLGNGVAATTADVDAADKTEKNLILVGGPYANDLVNELAEEGLTYTREEWDAMTGQAIVQYVAGGFADDMDVIIVAGYAAADTRAAALALATEPLTGVGQSWMGSTQEEFTYEAPAAEEEEADADAAENETA